MSQHSTGYLLVQHGPVGPMLLFLGEAVRADCLRVSSAERRNVVFSEKGEGLSPNRPFPRTWMSLSHA